MRKYLVYTALSVIVVVLIYFVYNINTVNVLNQESVIEGINEYRQNAVNQIKMSKFDEDEYFVMYKDLDGNIHLCIFEKKKISFGRYYFASGGSSGGVPGDFLISEGTSKGHKQLSVAYGTTSSLSDGSFKVIMQNETFKVSPSEEYFLEVFREETEEPSMIHFDFNQSDS